MIILSESQANLKVLYTFSVQSEIKKKFNSKFVLDILSQLTLEFKQFLDLDGLAKEIYFKIYITMWLWNFDITFNWKWLIHNMTFKIFVNKKFMDICFFLSVYRISLFLASWAAKHKIFTIS